MAKKETTQAELILDNKIILRSVYGKVGMKYFIQPCKDKLGRLPKCIKQVDSHGDMILSDEEKNDYAEKRAIYFPINTTFVITDGQVFDLNNPEDKAKWEAIQNCPLIAPELTAKNPDGTYMIHGTTDRKEVRHRRYGIAELYIDRPGVETQRRVSKKQKIIKACNYIIEDELGSEGRLMKAKLLGKHMTNMPSADVEDYLLNVAEKDPDKIIKLYTADDQDLRLLLVEARDKKVVTIKDRVFIYGTRPIGGTEEAALAWMKNPANKKYLEMLKQDTFPDLQAKEEE
jgi:hypothetical protein